MSELQNIEFLIREAAEPVDQILKEIDVLSEKFDEIERNGRIHLLRHEVREFLKRTQRVIGKAEGYRAALAQGVNHYVKFRPHSQDE